MRCKLLQRKFFYKSLILLEIDRFICYNYCSIKLVDATANAYALCLRIVLTHSAFLNNYITYSLARVTNRFPANIKHQARCLVLYVWQGRRDSNTQPTVLETATLPLSHSPKWFVNICDYIRFFSFSQSKKCEKRKNIR